MERNASTMSGERSKEYGSDKARSQRNSTGKQEESTLGTMVFSALISKPIVQLDNINQMTSYNQGKKEREHS